MSVEALAWAWRQALSPTEKLVLLAIADHSGSDGVCWPGIKGLAKKTGLSRSTVIRTVGYLEDFSMLRVEPRKDKAGRSMSHFYQLPMGRVSPSDPGVSLEDGEGVTARRGRVSQRDPNHHIEPSLEPSEDLTPPSPPRGVRKQYPEAFETFWQAYPRKEAKGAAAKAWERAVKSGVKPEALLQGVAHHQLHNPQWNRDGGQFIPHPATWLNQRRWEDDLSATGGTNGRSPFTPTAERAIRLADALRERDPNEADAGGGRATQ